MLNLVKLAFVLTFIVSLGTNLFLEEHDGSMQVMNP